jgi:hypothetical protein
VGSSLGHRRTNTEIKIFARRVSIVVAARFCCKKNQVQKAALNSALERVGGDGEREDERKGRVELGRRAVVFAPARRPLVFGVDEQGDAADIIGDPDAAVGRAPQESAAESAAMRRFIDGQTAEAKHGRVVTREAFLRERRRAAVFGRCRAQGVEAEDARRGIGGRGDEASEALVESIRTRKSCRHPALSRRHSHISSRGGVVARWRSS